MLIFVMRHENYFRANFVVLLCNKSRQVLLTQSVDFLRPTQLNSIINTEIAKLKLHECVEDPASGSNTGKAKAQTCLERVRETGRFHASPFAAREKRRTLRRWRAKVRVAVSGLTVWSSSFHHFLLLYRKLVAQKQEETW